MIDINAIDTAMKAAAIDKSAFDLDPKVRLSEQDLDSLDIFNILLELQDETGVTISDEEIEGLSNLELIIEHFNRAQRD